MNLKDAIESAQELANENRETILVCTDRDANMRAPFYWTVADREKHWMLGDGASIVKRIRPATL